MGERPQAIVVESDRKRRREVNPIPQEQITFLEFASGQEWTGEGFRLKVLEQTKSGRYKVYIDNKETGVAEVRDDTLDIEALKSLVIEKGLKLATPQEPVAPMSEEAAPVVVDLEAERIARGGDAISPDITADNVARQELTRINSETEEIEKRIAETLTEMTMLLVTAEEGEGKSTLQGEVMRISEAKLQMLNLAYADELGDVSLSQQLEGRRKLLQNLQQLEMEAVLLRDQIQKALTASSGESSSDSSSPAPTSGTSSTDVKPEPNLKRKSKGGDGGNGEVTDNEKEFKAFLERPDGKEIVDTYKMIIKGEWQYFTQAISRTQKYLSLNEKIDVWENDEQMLPAILTQLSKDLTQKRSVTKDQASSILRVVLGQLHTEFLDKQEEKHKQNQGAK